MLLAAGVRVPAGTTLDELVDEVAHALGLWRFAALDGQDFPPAPGDRRADPVPEG